jgi:hypothetical protein
VKINEIPTELKGHVHPKVVDILVALATEIATLKQLNNKMGNNFVKLLDLFNTVAKSADVNNKAILALKGEMRKEELAAEEFNSEEIDDVTSQG